LGNREPSFQEKKNKSDKRQPSSKGISKGTGVNRTSSARKKKPKKDPSERKKKVPQSPFKASPGEKRKGPGKTEIERRGRHHLTKRIRHRTGEKTRISIEIEKNVRLRHRRQGSLTDSFQEEHGQTVEKKGNRRYSPGNTVIKKRKRAIPRGKK